MIDDIDLRRRVMDELDWGPTLDAAHIAVTAADADTADVTAPAWKRTPPNSQGLPGAERMRRLPYMRTGKAIVRTGVLHAHVEDDRRLHELVATRNRSDALAHRARRTLETRGEVRSRGPRRARGWWRSRRSRRPRTVATGQW